MTCTQTYNYNKSFYNARMVSLIAESEAWSKQCSVLFFSRPRSAGWPHHGRTFSTYPCPLSFSLYMYTHTLLTALCPGLPGWVGTRKVKPIWILLKQETVSGSGISWAICKSAPRSRQVTTPAPHRSVFYRPDALPAAQPTASKH